MRMLASIRIDWFVISVSPLVASIGIDWFVISVLPLVMSIGIDWFVISVSSLLRKHWKEELACSCPIALNRMSTLVFVDPRVPPKLTDLRAPVCQYPCWRPYECQLVDFTYTPLVGHVKELDGSDTSGAGSTTACMVVRVQPTMSPGCSARIAEVAAMSDVAFHKRFRSPYESLPSPSHTLPVWKRYRGTSKLVLSTDSEANELGDEEDSLDSDSGSEGAEDEGPTAGMRIPLVAEGDQRYSTFEVGQGSGSAPEPVRSERVSAFRQPTLTTWTDPEDGTIYIDVPTYPPPAPPVQTPPSPDWTLGSLPISPPHSDVPSHVSSPLISLTVPSPVVIPTATIPVDEDQFIEIDRDVRELYTRSGAVRDEIFSQRYQFRSLEQGQERAVMTFGALWRPVLALEAWAGHVDTRMASMSRAGYDDHRLVHDLLVQQAALQRELQEMRGRVTALEQERDRREQ
ncbi:hypothetical protein Tco_0149461 [Tanacetum coccineum]